MENSKFWQGYRKIDAITTESNSVVSQSIKHRVAFSFSFSFLSFFFEGTGA
jgi:hypothetical protein